MAFSLDESALHVLRRLAVDSDCVEPVAVFSKRTNVANASGELREALASGDQQRIQEAAESEWLSSSEGMTVFLDVCMYEKASIHPTDIVSVDGVAFELPPPFKTLLQSAQLFNENGLFVLRDRDGRVVDLPLGPPDSRLG